MAEKAKAKKKACGAKSPKLEDGSILTCVQTSHPFPTHSDANGQAWSDISLLDQPVVEELPEEDEIAPGDFELPEQNEVLPGD